MFLFDVWLIGRCNMYVEGKFIGGFFLGCDDSL